MAEHQNLVTDENLPRASGCEGVTDSLPRVIGYLPVAFAFGLNASRPGFTPSEASVSSSSLTDILAILPTLVGFGLLSITFYFSRSIVYSTLLSALGYGVTWKLLMMAA